MSGEAYHIPPYPAHLTEDERTAVFFHAVEQTRKSSFPTDETAVLVEVLKHAAAIAIVRHDWQGDRIKRLEQRCADLESALAKRDITPAVKRGKDGRGAR